MAFYAGLDSETYDRQYSNKALLSRIWRYARAYKKQIIVILIAIFLQGSIGALPPLLISKVLDEGIAGVPDRSVFYLLAALVIIVEVLGFVFYYVNHRFLARVIADINRDLSTDAFAASMRQDMAFHDRYSSGRILSRITTDTRDFSTFITITMDVANQALQ